jgi:hypothetical protein
VYLIRIAHGVATSFAAILCLVQPEVDIAVLRAATRLSVQELAKGNVTVDPRSMMTGTRGPLVQSDSVHPESVLRALGSDDFATVVTFDHAVQCDGGGVPLPQCLMDGRLSLLTLSSPAIRGDSASVEVRVNEARALTPADTVAAGSADSTIAARTGRSNLEFFLRLRATAHVSKYRLNMVRQGDTWTVTSHTLLLAGR